MHFEKEGAFTGEVSALMLKDAGARHVILGHSERRQLFGETDEGVAKKTKAALAARPLPIVCVGETLAEREAGRTMEVVGRQLDAILARGHGRRGEAGRRRLRARLGDRHRQGRDARAGPGGPRLHPLARRREHGEASADVAPHPLRRQRQARQHRRLMAQADVDGALVGGASLKADSFLKLVHYDRP